MHCPPLSLGAPSAPRPLHSPLVAPVSVGRMQLAHRIVLPALTRLRMEPGSEKPRDLNALYYEQRTSRGGLLVSEGIHIDSVTARGFVRAPVLERQVPARQLGGSRGVDR